MKLYQTQLGFEKDTTFTTTAKASEQTDLNLVLTYDDGKSETIKGDKAIESDWTTVTYDVKKAAGKTVTGIDYELVSKESSDTYEFRFGQIAVKPDLKTESLSVEGLEIEDAIFDEEESNYAGVRLIWKDIDSDSLASYEVYRVNDDK
ncbi:hypothetical protein J8385_19950, partial [Acinetobacter baumannii]|nr:hypothetical protein [Acinetobacter baumannii]